MAKPTLIQSLLNLPSQAYHFPSSKDYHSNRHDLMRAAAEATSADTPQQSRYSVSRDSDSELYISTPPSRRTSSAVSFYSEAHSRPHSLRDPERVSHPIYPGLDVRASNSQSIVSSPGSPPRPTLSIIRKPVPPLPVDVEEPAVEPKVDRPVPSPGDSGIDTEYKSDDEGSSDDEAYYTPRQSFYGSPRISRTSAGMLIDPKALVEALLPLPVRRSRSNSDSSPDSRPADVDSLFSSSPASAASEVSLLSSSSSSTENGTVVTSTSRATTSTQITTPLTSDYGTHKAPNGHVKTITIASSSKSGSETSSTPPGSVRQPRPLAATATKKRRSLDIQRLTYTDEDWAKEVRWLAPAITTESPRRLSQTLPPDLAPPAEVPTPTRLVPQRGPNTYPPPAKSAEHRKRTRRSRGSRSSRGRMSALLEEDESEYSDVTPGASDAEHSRGPSPVQEETLQVPKQGVSVFHSRLARSGQEPSASSSEDAHENPDARVEAYARSKGQPRRSYSHTRPLSRSLSPTSWSYSKGLPTHSIPTPFPSSTSPPAANGYTSLTLPRAAFVGDGKAALEDGKVDLVRAGLAQSSMATIEVTRGVAQKAPTDVKRKRRTLPFNFSIKFAKSKGKGKESATPAHLLNSLPLPVAFTSHLPPPTLVPSSHVLVQIHAVALDGLDSLLVDGKAADIGKGAGFIPGRSIAGKVVEVGWEVNGDVCKRGDWVIGLLDIKKSGALSEFAVVERHRIHRAPQPLSRPTTLFPPGRRSHVRSMSLPSQLIRHPLASVHQGLLATGMSVEELALLPLCALPAHRAVRTMIDAIAPPLATSSKSKPNEPSTTPRPRVLVLQGHDGSGAIAVQILAKRNIRVTVQVPDSAARDDASEDEAESDSHTSSGHPGARRKPTRFDRLESRLRDWGAEEVCVGQPLEVLERLVDDSRSFDGILDTVGGTDVWDLGRKLLLGDPAMDATIRSSLSADSTTPSTSTITPSTSSSGGNGLVRASSRARNRSYHVTQFATLVGDVPNKAIPTAQDNLRAGFRSVRRSSSSRSRSRSPSRAPNIAPSISSKDSLGSFPLLRRNTTGKVKAQKRSVSYTWISPIADVDFAGEDIRDSLGAVVGMVEEGWVRPWMGEDVEEEGEKKIVPFEKAPEVFRRVAGQPVGLLKDGGTCVVKVIG